MQKKLLASAVLAAIALPAAAQSNVTISGRAWLAFENVHNSGATAGSAKNLGTTQRVTSYPSYLRFAGQEDLGGGLAAWFQFENDILLDTGGGPTATRNTGVGLKGNWGNVLMGRWDSPYKNATSRLDPFDISGLGSYQNILGQIQTATDKADNFFDARMANGAQYWSPSFAGFSLRLGYIPGEGKNDFIDPAVYSGAVKYENGPIYLTVAHEHRKDCGNIESTCNGSLLGGTNSDGIDRGTRVGGSYSFGDTTVSAVWERLHASTHASGGQDLKRNAVFLGLEHKMGVHTLKGAYGRAFEASGSSSVAQDDSGAWYYTVGYDHSLSKRTSLFALYSSIENEKNAAYRFGSRGIGAVANGSDSGGLSAGIKHLF